VTLFLSGVSRNGGFNRHRQAPIGNYDMYQNNKVGVVVPAHNEEIFIGNVIDTIPDFVDKIYVVDDASQDKTFEIIMSKARQNSKIIPVSRKINGGVGAAIITGHMRALEDNLDVIAVLAGDGQMDPAILPRFIGPIVEDKADYCKGNRLSDQTNKKEMPAWRYFGNNLLTILSRISSGYWHIGDPQNGYTAISVKMLKRIDLESVEKGFAFENDMLVKLNVANARVMDVPHPAIYRGQKSKIRYSKFIVNTSWIISKDCIWRIWTKYIKRNHSNKN
jgi:glycosyltransferase involved in cell wall biosynthesis